MSCSVYTLILILALVILNTHKQNSTDKQNITATTNNK